MPLASAPALGEPSLLPTHVGYLVNEYPKVSHSFIRREIAALERAGCRVTRYSVRGWSATLVDPADVDERTRTTYLLQGGLGALLPALAGCALRRPGAWCGALALAWKMSRRGDRGFAYHLVYLAQACRLVRLAERDRVGHLHAHFATNPAEVAMLSQALGGPTYSFTVHGPEDFDKPEALGIPRKIRHAAFVVAITSFCRSQLMRWCDITHWAKLHVVHCGLDPADLADGPRTVAATPSFVCVGRLCEQKGQMLLLDAWAALRDQGLTASLVLAGDGEMRTQIEARIGALGLQDHVSITGWLSGQQVRDEIERARALVLPSFAEGLPVVIMEAMAMGRPVITTFVAGIPELVRSGVDGWLIPAGNLEALVDALRQCLQTGPQALVRMGADALVRVRERHCADREAAKLLQLFRHQMGVVGPLPAGGA